jgi:hypothetical protein
LITAVALLLFANPENPTTMPRQRDAEPSVQQDAEREGGAPTDPLFDRKLVATDDPTFIAQAIESGRQGQTDAGALGDAATPALKSAAANIEQQSRSSTEKLEALAKRKGWRVPEQNPNRAVSVKTGSPTRSRANYIVHQIAWHQATIEQFRAQIAGKGDAELKKALAAQLPGYEKNLQSLIALEPTKAL